MLPVVVADEQVKEGWDRYLSETRNANDFDYEDIERAAWDRLIAHLTAIGKPLVRRKGKVIV